MASTPEIYGARLANSSFGAEAPGGSWDEGFVQTSELEHAVENERIRDDQGRFIGGCKYGPSNGFTFTYVSKNATNTDFGRVTSDTEPRVLLHTAFGGTRILEMPYGEDLPRIC